MAWPRKGTHKITIDETMFLWHFRGHCLSCCEDPITIGVEGGRYVLFLDTCTWNFEMTPAFIARAIRWAILEGWTPQNGPTRTLAMNPDNQFQWLPEGVAHLYLIDPKAEKSVGSSLQQPEKKPHQVTQTRCGS